MTRTEILRQSRDASVTQDDLLWRLERRLRDLSDGSAFVLLPTERHARVGPIVCVVDASSDARRAMRFAGELATEAGVPLVLAHVVSPAEPGDLDARAVGVRAGLTNQHRLAANVRRMFGDRKVELLSGDASSTQSLLARFARQQDARLMFVSGPAWLSADVSRALPCPVVVMSPSIGGGRHLPC